MATEYRWHRAGRFVEFLGPGKGSKVIHGVSIVIGKTDRVAKIELTERQIIEAIRELSESLESMRAARERQP